MTYPTESGLAREATSKKRNGEFEPEYQYVSVEHQAGEQDIVLPFSVRVF